jgi:hypothetical protein
MPCDLLDSKGLAPLIRSLDTRHLQVPVTLFPDTHSPMSCLGTRNCLNALETIKCEPAVTNLIFRWIFLVAKADMSVVRFLPPAR